MRNRDYKQFAQGGIYHIYNRGVGKMKIFLDNEDYEMFLSRLEENLFPEKIDSSNFSWAEKRRKLLSPNSFDLVSYCLMPNHFHLIIQQLSTVSLSSLLLKVCTSYAMYFNKKYERVGTLFQDQSKAVLIETNEQLLWTSFYVHKNPLEAEIVKELSDHKWNSYLEYAGLENRSLCKKGILIGQFNSRESFLVHFKESIISESKNYKLVGIQHLLIDNFD